MKKLIAVTTSLCAAVCTAVFSGAAAHAETASVGLDYYPQNFTKEIEFKNLEDYAVGNGKYAFLENNVVYEFDGVNFYSFEDGSVEVTGVYYKDGSILCYGTLDEDGTEVIYEHGTKENPVEITVAKPITDEYVYSESENGEGLVIYKLGSESTATLEGFSKPKIFNGTVYAVYQNSLYSLDGTESAKLKLEYLDYSAADKISLGNSAEVINKFNLPAPQFVSLKNGAFMTEINIDEANGEYFKTGATVKAGAAVPYSTALLLARFGADDKISIVMVSERGGAKSKCYLMHSDNAPANAREAVTEKTLGATVTVDDGYLYTAPYVCSNTRLSEDGEQIKIKSGDAVKVVGEVKKEDNPELVRSFYKVEFTDKEGKTHTGYVPTNYVSPFAFIENPPVETPDPDYTEENLIKTVVLVILVVVLVLAAGGYMVYALWTGKFKKKDKK